MDSCLCLRIWLLLVLILKTMLKKVHPNCGLNFVISKVPTWKFCLSYLVVHTEYILLHSEPESEHWLTLFACFLLLLSKPINFVRELIIWPFLTYKCGNFIWFNLYLWCCRSKWLQSLIFMVSHYNLLKMCLKQSITNCKYPSSFLSNTCLSDYFSKTIFSKSNFIFLSYWWFHLVVGSLISPLCSSKYPQVLLSVHLFFFSMILLKNKLVL